MLQFFFSFTAKLKRRVENAILLFDLHFCYSEFMCLLASILIFNIHFLVFIFTSPSKHYPLWDIYNISCHILRFWNLKKIRIKKSLCFHLCDHKSDYMLKWLRFNENALKRPKKRPRNAVWDMRVYGTYIQVVQEQPAG